MKQDNDSFGDLKTKIASNGCQIIEEALAYLECTVQSSKFCTYQGLPIMVKADQ